MDKSAPSTRTVSSTQTASLAKPLPSVQSVSNIQRDFILNHQKRKRMVIYIRVLILIVFFALWEFSARAGILDAFIFSSPTRILSCMLQMTSDGSLFYHTGITIAETIISFLLVTGIGLLVAILLWTKQSLSEILEPYLVVLNSLPKTALAPVLIVWLGNNIKTIIVAAVSVAVFGTILTIYTGFQSVDPEKIKLIYTFQGTRKDVLLKVILPSTVPLIISTMKVNIGLSLVGVIIGEFLAANAGLGYLIIYGSQVFKLDWVLMSILILCVLAGILYLITGRLEKRYGKLK